MNKDTKEQFRLVGGPLHDQLLDLPKGTEEHRIGPKGCPFFTYTYAGREGATRLLAIRPSSRSDRRFVRDFVSANGRDPRAEPGMRTSWWRR